MFAINHAASALIFKRHLGDRISFLWLLIAAQLVELLWVLLNLIGVEHVTTEDTVHYIGDIHLSFMPYSHSIASSVILAFFAIIGFGVWFRSWKISVGMGLAFLSHIILDILTHARDLPLGFANARFIGIGLYDSWPLLGFVVELAFGLFCWWYYRGNIALLFTILLFNISNLTMFLPKVAGPESLMADKPTLIVLVVFAQILITLSLVGWFARRSPVRTNGRDFAKNKL